MCISTSMYMYIYIINTVQPCVKGVHVCKVQKICTMMNCHKNKFSDVKDYWYTVSVFTTITNTMQFPTSYTPLMLGFSCSRCRLIWNRGLSAHCTWPRGLSHPGTLMLDLFGLAPDPFFGVPEWHCFVAVISLSTSWYASEPDGICPRLMFHTFFLRTGIGCDMAVENSDFCGELSWLSLSWSVDFCGSVCWSSGPIVE